MNLPFVAARAYRPLLCVENEDADFDADLADKYRGECLKISVHWAIVERDGWGYVDRKIGSFDGPLFINIKGAPSSITLAETCRPIPAHAWGDYASFVSETITRYPTVYIVEFMNEPDTSASWAEWWLGCWGDDYASGVYYGEFVNAVYDTLKPRYPLVRFIAGAFIRSDSDFASGALATMQTDGASFHYYPQCGATSEYTHIERTMRAGTKLPLYFSETGLLYDDANAADCEQVQAAYLASLQEYSNVMLVNYYTLGCRAWDWRNSSIYGDDCRIKPAVAAYERFFR